MEQLQVGDWGRYAVIEAELKARLVNPEQVRRRLDELAPGAVEEYRDTYFDTPTGDLERDGRELRIRTILGQDGPRHVVTRKGAPVDEVSGSKPEREEEVPDPEVAADQLAADGYRPVLSFTKRCVNYRLAAEGRQFLATLVTVPELAGTFLEVETLVEAQDLESALRAVRRVMASLGVRDGELTTDTYTDAVRTVRTAKP